jgi:hypothetical protein
MKYDKLDNEVFEIGAFDWFRGPKTLVMKKKLPFETMPNHVLVYGKYKKVKFFRAEDIITKRCSVYEFEFLQGGLNDPEINFINVVICWK